jgi:hypothetical protein
MGTAVNHHHAPGQYIGQRPTDWFLLSLTTTATTNTWSVIGNKLPPEQSRIRLDVPLSSRMPIMIQQGQSQHVW